MLARVSGVKISLRAFRNQIQAVVIPLAMLALSYHFFLQRYVFDWSQPLKIFLDFGYPLGQALYVSIAILAFLLSRKVLGGMMRFPILAFIFALIAQYLSDFTFLMQAQNSSFYAGGINDLMYSTSYTLMAFALFYIAIIHTKIKDS
jgi:hypothetical protein